MLKNINLVKERFLSLPSRVESGLEKELSLSDFENRNLLDSGSFASVFEAYSKTLKMKIALKSLPKALIKKEHNLPQVQREISLMYQLRHPHIIQLFTHFEDDEYIHLVLELATNGNLLGKLRKQEKGYLPEKKVLKYIIQIVKALKYLHSQNPPVLHRDLKPENVLLDKDDNCKLADFGSANQKVLTATFCGTPLYMAPEMLLKEEYDQNVDIWSLGVLIFELLSGKPAFNVSQTLDIFDAQAALSKNILEMGLEFPKWFPTLAKDLLDKMMKKNPKKRINIQEVEKHEWLKMNETCESVIIENSRLRSKSLRYGYFAEIKGNTRKSVVEIEEELKKCAFENKSQKILDDLNRNMSNSLEVLNEMKVKFEVLNLKYNRMNWFHEKIQRENDVSGDEFLEKIQKFKELTKKKQELKEKVLNEQVNLEKIEENGFNIELELLKSQQDHENFQKDLEKINALESKKKTLIMKKDDILKEIESKSSEIKQKKAELANSEEKTKQNSKDATKTKENTIENSKGNINLLSVFLEKAKFLIREHKKILLLHDNKNSRFLEMKKELREIDQNLLKKKEELEKQLNFEFEESLVRITSDFEREKQYLEDDFYSQKNQLEKKIQRLKLENYNLKSKVHINEETSKPRFESLMQLIDKYQENKLTLENIIGKKEKKLNEIKDFLKDNAEVIEKKIKKKHNFTKFLYGSFGSEKKVKERKSNQK